MENNSLSQTLKDKDNSYDDSNEILYFSINQDNK